MKIVIFVDRRRRLNKSLRGSFLNSIVILFVANNSETLKFRTLGELLSKFLNLQQFVDVVILLLFRDNYDNLSTNRVA